MSNEARIRAAIDSIAESLTQTASEWVAREASESALERDVAREPTNPEVLMALGSVLALAGLGDELANRASQESTGSKNQATDFAFRALSAATNGERGEVEGILQECRSLDDIFELYPLQMAKVAASTDRAIRLREAFADRVVSMLDSVGLTIPDVESRASRLPPDCARFVESASCWLFERDSRRRGATRDAVHFHGSAAANGAAPSSVEAEAITLTVHEAEVLRVLQAKRVNMLMADMEVATRLSKQTISAAVESLENKGLICRPSGQRKGVVATTKGRGFKTGD